MREQFSAKLEEVASETRKLLVRDAEAIRDLAGDLVSDTVRTMKEVEAFEEETGRLHRNVEHLVMVLLLMQHPVAGDLHALTTSLSMHRDIVRISIQVTEAQRLWIHLPTEGREACAPLKPTVIALSKMADALVAAMESGEEVQLHQVIESDDEVDKGFDDWKHAVAEALQERRINPAVAVDTLLLGKYFEKMGDHLSAIAKAEMRRIDKEW